MTQSSPAYQAGVIAGIIIFFSLVLGLMVFFVVSLVKATTTRRPGWIVAASLSGVPFALFLVFMVFAFVAGFKRGLNRSSEISAARRGEPSQLLTADMTPISGNALPYQISLPSIDEWQKKTSLRQYDNLFVYHDSAYLGIIAEGVGLGTPQHICDISQKHFKEKAAECTFTDVQPIDIDSHSWLTYDVDATISYAHIKYRVYVYADANYTIQILAWSGGALFDHNAPVFDRIAKSFKLPQ
ncbi:MAG TPA: hypothetical protein VMF08_18020 [Candidatus Sulfotelmatobacter sp.]|nr:hypothetical protein [Candidatus Sulfotelmatobacter sp.]